MAPCSPPIKDAGSSQIDTRFQLNYGPSAEPATSQNGRAGEIRNR
jgi:Integrase core domain